MDFSEMRKEIDAKKSEMWKYYYYVNNLRTEIEKREEELKEMCDHPADQVDNYDNGNIHDRSEYQCKQCGCRLFYGEF